MALSRIQPFEFHSARQDTRPLPHGLGSRGARDERDPGHHTSGRVVRAPGRLHRLHRRAASALRRAGGPEPTRGLWRGRLPAHASHVSSHLCATTHEPGHRLAASPGPRRARGLWRPGVGAVGMCITGGFALAMTVEEVVLAPVLSQPALPFPLNRAHRRDLGISDEDLARVRGRCRTGNVSVLGLRFSGDKAVRLSVSRGCARNSGRLCRGRDRLGTRQPGGLPKRCPLGADRGPPRPREQRDARRVGSGPRSVQT